MKHSEMHLKEIELLNKIYTEIKTFNNRWFYITITLIAAVTGINLIS